MLRSISAYIAIFDALLLAVTLELIYVGRFGSATAL
jgi:hypothetical protein